MTRVPDARYPKLLTATALPHAACAQMLHRHRPPPRRGGGFHRPRKGFVDTFPGLAECLLLVLIALVSVASVLYASTSSSRARSRRHEEGSAPSPPRVTIFSAPRPPPDGSPARQDLAVRSWLALPGDVSVVLFDANSAAAALADRLGGRVTVEAAVDSA
jgi:beta-arabinofuranosyltransferase